MGGTIAREDLDSEAARGLIAELTAPSTIPTIRPKVATAIPPAS